MKEYSFVDMHIHTEWSTEEGCDNTISETMERAQKIALRTNKPCLISITDHNSILGARLAQELKNNNPQAFSLVELVPGIEFTTDLIETLGYTGGERVYKRCHMLAYNYDLDNKEMIAYSEITHWEMPNECNIGLQICAARRILNEKYGANITFEELDILKQSSNYKQIRKKFLEIVFEKISDVTIEKIDSVIEPYFGLKQEHNRLANSHGRLKLSEVATMVNQAGGEMVLAHPGLLKYKDTQLIDKDHKKEIIEKFLDLVEKITGQKVAGIEQFYSINYDFHVFEAIGQIVKERGLYVTAGSDYHGEHMKSEKEIGYVFSYLLNKNFITSIPHVGRANAFVCCLSALDWLVDGLGTAYDYRIKTFEDEVVKCEEFEKIVANITRPSFAQKEAKTKYRNKVTEIIERTKKLTVIAHKFNTILNSSVSSNKKAKFLLMVNEFAYKILKGLDVLQQDIMKEPNLLVTQEIKSMKKVLEDIRNKYSLLEKRNPNLIRDLQNDIKYYYLDTRESSIERLSKVTITDSSIEF